MDSVNIRRASSSDLDALGALNVEVHELHREREPNFFKPLAPGAIRDSILSFMNGSNVATFVAEEGGRLVGFVQAKTEETMENPFHKRVRRGVINAIGVTAGVKRGGVGSRLLDAAEDWVRGSGFQEVLLNVWEFNEAARGYFTSSRKMTRVLAKL